MCWKELQVIARKILPFLVYLMFWELKGPGVLPVYVIFVNFSNGSALLGQNVPKHETGMLSNELRFCDDDYIALLLD